MFGLNKKKDLTVEELKDILKNLKTDDDKQYVNETSVYYKNVPDKFFIENKEYIEFRREQIRQMIKLI